VVKKNEEPIKKQESMKNEEIIQMKVESLVVSKQ
jgi:hypothetical protein